MSKRPGRSGGSKGRDGRRNNKTPDHTKWKPGESGNHSGRPKGSKSTGTMVKEILDQPVTAKIRGKDVRMPFRKAMLLKAADDAIDFTEANLDLAIRWGFGWDTGPFEIWQSAGWQRIAGWIQEDIAAGRMMAPVPLPAWVTEQGRTSRQVYLPAGSDWYDYWTNRRHAGGQTIEAAAPIDRIPLFVRAGSIAI